MTNQRALMDDVDDYGLSEAYFVGCSVDYTHQYGEGSSSSSSFSSSPLLPDTLSSILPVQLLREMLMFKRMNAITNNR